MNILKRGVIAMMLVAVTNSAILVSCCQQETSLDFVQCEVLSSMEQYPDSSYFKEISCMYYQNNKLYLFDKSRGDVAVDAFSGNLFYTVGKIGQGPTEVAAPTGFSVLPNGNVALLDGGNLSLKIYNESGFVTSYDVPSGSDNRFFTEGNKTYLTLATDTSSYVKTSSSWKRGTNDGLELHGSSLHITDDPGMNIIRNRRHLVKGEGCLYAIPSSYPVIERYELGSEKLLDTFDLSEIDCIGNIWSSIGRNTSSPKSFYIFLKDVYYADGKLYILYADWENQYSVNHILVLETKGRLTPIYIYKLPGIIYDSFAVNDNLIYAMNYEKNEIQTIRPLISH